MATTTPDVFSAVLEKFKSRLTAKEIMDFGATTLEELQLTIAAIQKKQASTSSMRNAARLRGFLEAIEKYSTILDLFVNVNNFVAFVWGPVKYLLLIAKDWADAFSALIDAYQRIAESLPALEQYHAIFGDDLVLRRALEAMFRDIFEFHSSALKYFKGPVWKQVFHATWKQFDAKFKTILVNMDHHKQLIQTHADLIHFQEAQNARDRAARAFDDQEKFELLQRRTHLLSWLSAADVRSDQMRGAQAREDHPESGRWLLSKDKFRSWFDMTLLSNASLWITGIPGAGKTVLASLIVEEAEALTSYRTLYFYCRDGDPQRNSFVAMARSLLAQSLRSEDTLINFLYEAAAASKEKVLSTAKTAKPLLEVCLEALGSTYIIIDGVDECPPPEQRSIAGWLKKYAESTSSTSRPNRCVFLSQDDAQTRQLFSKLPTVQIRPGDNSADIAAYCHSWAQKVRSKFGLEEDEASKMAKITAERADGMFLFARLVMGNLNDQTRRSGLDKELQPDIFPHGLNAAYDRILVRIVDDAPPSEKEDAERLLAWLVCAVRPLKWCEIQAAVSLDSDQERIDYAQHRLRVDAKHLCGSLIEECPDGQVTFVHLSAKLYLTSTRRIIVDVENLKLADRCLEYLCLPFFNRDIEDSVMDNFILEGSYAFLDYAIMAWTKHIEYGINVNTVPRKLKQLEEILESFFIFHWQEPQEQSHASRNMEAAVAAIHDINLKAKTLQSMAALHALSSGKRPDVVATTDLFNILYRFRGRLEAICVQGSETDTLRGFYGTKVFKCHRPHCVQFYQGFVSDVMRKPHLDRHEKPYACTFPGCTSTTLAFATKHELRDHIRNYHKSIPADDDFSVDDGDKNSLEDSHLQKAAMPAGNHVCTICNKVYSKASSLRAHKQTHNAERHLTCSTCGMKFPRKADLARHENVHSGKKDFVCFRKSYSGADMGCRRTFSRADQLKRHLSSPAGRPCQRAMDEDQATSQVAKYVASLSPEHRSLVRKIDFGDTVNTDFIPLPSPSTSKGAGIALPSVNHALKLVGITMQTQSKSLAETSDAVGSAIAVGSEGVDTSADATLHETELLDLLDMDSTPSENAVTESRST